jgi:hypothetical protein
MATCELLRQRKLFSQSAEPPLSSKGEGVFFGLKMWMPNKNGGECPAESESLAETQPTLRHAFRHVYGFILHSVRGDKAAADAIFENYLAGKLSEELLSISRRCVSSDQAGSSKRDREKGLGGAETINSGRGVGVGDDAFTALS